MATKKKTTLKPGQRKVEGFATKAASKSGQVPEGRVRFSVNLPVEVHEKLRRAAGRRTADTGKQVTMGELVAELVDKYL
jgi:hypothetical protein